MDADRERGRVAGAWDEGGGGDAGKGSWDYRLNWLQFAQEELYCHYYIIQFYAPPDDQRLWPVRTWDTFDSWCYQADKSLCSFP